MSSFDAAGPIVKFHVSTASVSAIQIAPASGGRRIRILQAFLSSDSATNVTLTLQDEDGNAIVGPVTLIQDKGRALVLPFSPIGWGDDLVAGKALHLLLSAAVTVDGPVAVQYI